MPFFLALLSAVTYGAADFFGGMAARRATTIAVVIVSQAAGLAMLLIALPLLPGIVVTPRDLWWGAAAGFAGGVGVALLYRGLAIGPMSLVAPVTAVCAVAVPVTVGLAFGERLTTVALAGIGLAAVAIVLLGQEQPRTNVTAVAAVGSRRAAIALALSSGIAVGLFLVALERTSQAAGLGPLVPARLVSISLFLALGLATRQPVLVPRSVMGIAILGGGLDMLANALYMIAVQQGPLSVIATLASLYPASTVILARVIYHERSSRLQLIGIVCAIVAIVLIVGGGS